MGPATPADPGGRAAARPFPRPRLAILGAIDEVTGELPPVSRKVPLDVQVHEEHEADGLIWRKLTFAPEAGDRVPAWLLLPRARRGAPPGAAVLALHQTTRIGKDEPVGRGGLPNLHYALELARRGYVVLAPDYPRFGDSTTNAYALGYASATMKGLWNHWRALELLSALPQVDAQRLGVIGHSLGAENALFLAAFALEVAACVASGGFTRFTWNNNEGRGEHGDVSDWSHQGYMPRIAERYGCRAERLPFDWEDLLAAIAPRPLFLNAPLSDFFQWQGVDECVNLVTPLYVRAKARDALAVRHQPGGHDFPRAVRAEAYAFLDRHLRHAPAVG